MRSENLESFLIGKNGVCKLFRLSNPELSSTRAVAGGGGGRHLGLRPKPRGGFAARSLLGARSPDPRWGSAPNPVGGCAPRPPRERGLGRRPSVEPSGGLGRSLRHRSCGEAAPGFGAEPQLRGPWPPLAQKNAERLVASGRRGGITELLLAGQYV